MNRKLFFAFLIISFVTGGLYLFGKYDPYAATSAQLLQLIYCACFIPLYWYLISSSEKVTFTLLEVSLFAVALSIAGTFALSGPIWSEEMGWLEIAKKVASGEILSPIGAKSDYPSRLQAWPIALIIKLGATPLWASRIVTVSELALTAMVLREISRLLISKSEIIGALALSLPLITGATLSFVGLGWHEVTPVPLLVSAQWLGLLQLIRAKSSKSAMAFGLICGISLWTLYTPALSALAFLICSLSIGSIPLIATLSTACLIGAVPILGHIYQTEGSILGRHVNFLAYGSDWARPQRSGLGDYLHEYLLRIEQFWLQIKPSISEINWIDLNAPKPELYFSIFVGLGLLICFTRRRLWIECIIPMIIVAIGLIASNATPWRSTGITAWILILAIIGSHWVINLLPRGKFQILAIFIIVSVQISSLILNFGLPAHKIMHRELRNNFLVQSFYDECQTALISSEIAIPDGLTAVLIRPLDSRIEPFKVYRNSAELTNIISDNVSQFVVSNLKTEPALIDLSTLGESFRSMREICQVQVLDVGSIVLYQLGD